MGACGVAVRLQRVARGPDEHVGDERTVLPALRVIAGVALAATVIGASDSASASAVGANGAEHSGARARTAESCAPGSSLPSAAGSGTTRVTATGATAHGDVTPNGCLTQYTFEYGTTTAYGSATLARNAGAGTSSKAVAARIVGLAANMTYHFRIAATNALGTTDGPDETFHTAAICTRGATLPSVTGTRVTQVTEFAARLNAVVNSNGCTATYQFAYWQGTRYERRTPIVHLSPASGPISASQAIRGLSPNTRYHFRLIAYGAGTKAFGPEVTFTTKLAAAVRIAARRAYLDHPFVAGIPLTCVQGAGGCAGAVKLFSSHRLIGRHRFRLSRGRTRLIPVGLDAVGRRLFRSRQALQVEVVVRLRYYVTRRFLPLTRRFAVSPT